MTNLTSTVLCSRIDERRWNVSCIRCIKPIGTMSSKMLRKAVWRNIYRGGVLCPACRGQSCVICGNELTDTNRFAPNARGTCQFCELGVDTERYEKLAEIFGRDEPSEFVGGTACLVPHISNQNNKSSLGTAVPLPWQKQAKTNRDCLCGSGSPGEACRLGCLGPAPEEKDVQ